MASDDEPAGTRGPDEGADGAAEEPVDVPPSETAADATGAVEPQESDDGDEGPDADVDADLAAEADALDHDFEAVDDEFESAGRELEEARAALAAAEKKAQDHLMQARRTLADFENYRRRMRTEMEQATVRAKAEVLRDFLAVMDNFDRALEHSGDEEALYDGLKLIYRQLRGILEAQGLRRVDSEGHAFDPQLHEAVMREPTAAYKEGVVIKEFEKGYFLGEKLLRPAKVKVAVAPPDGSDADASAEAPDESGDEDAS